MKLILLGIFITLTKPAFSFECRILPFHKISQNEQVEDNTTPPKEVSTSGECVDFAESKIASDLKSKKNFKVTAVDFIIQKKTSTIRGTVITPKMDFKN